MGPVSAIRKVLRIAGFTLSDIGLIELNEAFAAQALAVITNSASIRRASMSTEEPSPSATRSAAPVPSSPQTLLAEMRRRQLHYGMVTMCVGAAWARPPSSSCSSKLSFRS